jgi:nucleoside-diphosphate-sugar epimerase
MEQYIKQYQGKTVLVKGGAGCVGSNLVKALIKAEAGNIIILDDLSSAYEWNIPKVKSVTFIQGSILDEEMLKRAFRTQPEYVFHLAAHFANQNSVDNPETDLMVNGLGILKVLEYAHMVNAQRFVYSSSAVVFRA